MSDTITTPEPTLPLMPCEACRHDANCCTTTDRLTAVYCEHNRAGLHYGTGLFVLYQPIGRQEYGAVLAALDLRAEQLEQLHLAQAPLQPRPN